MNPTNNEKEISYIDVCLILSYSLLNSIKRKCFWQQIWILYMEGPRMIKAQAKLFEKGLEDQSFYSVKIRGLTMLWLKLF